MRRVPLIYPADLPPRSAAPMIWTGAASGNRQRRGVRPLVRCRALLLSERCCGVPRLESLCGPRCHSGARSRATRRSSRQRCRHSSARWAGHRHRPASCRRAPLPGGPTDRLVAWRYLGAGDGSVRVRQGPYKGKRTNRALVTSASIDGFATVDADGAGAASCGARRSGCVGWSGPTPRDAIPRMAPHSGCASIAQTGRWASSTTWAIGPFASPDWREYKIEGAGCGRCDERRVRRDGLGAVTAEFEAIGLGGARRRPARWAPIAIKDPGFEDSPDASSGGWVRAGTSKTAGDHAADRQGARRPAVPPHRAAASGATSQRRALREPPVTGAHADIDLGSGLKARVPLALSEAQASGTRTRLSGWQALRAAICRRRTSGDRPTSTRGWQTSSSPGMSSGISIHTGTRRRVDWDARLRPQIERAYDATTRDAHQDAMRLLVADVRDGHGASPTRRGTAERRRLPVQFGSSTVSSW